ncbi:hypothetical protein AWL63_24105 (plasmid) [Sphingomonas panacis]|uniref:SGNH hydrolase-type esterase domain-containing protein n=1 Tax=Sphingomonas panacis TaxID=1560345 RepID=A0A1B3ZII7_9SPHN|nr:hypothetical protein [Sphingomonas panacis]AOH87243.1 hypothetical protein AWL63_24105 [Sphingomonas panacis]
MFECLIMGDSTGVGTASAINARRTMHCDVIAAERATAKQILAWRKSTKTYGTAILAVGSNDIPGPALARDLAKMRSTLATRRVIWLLPYSRPAAGVVNSVAISFNDETLDLARFPSKDRVHPARYEDIAKALLK